MRDWGGAPGMQHTMLAEILGLAMARRAADILDRHRAALTSGPDSPNGPGGPGGPGGPVSKVGAVGDPGRASGTGGAPGTDGVGPPDVDDAQFALDNAIFTAVLDAANECLGRFDTRPADERWCDALLQLIQLAQVARHAAEPGQHG
jgi:hypothetical protein